MERDKKFVRYRGGKVSSTAVTQVVNKNTAYEQRLNRHLISMEGSAKVLVSQVDGLESFKRLENEYDKIVALRQQVFAIYDRLQLGISQLIQNQRVNTNLVSSKTMYKQLTMLTTKLRMDHKDLLLTDRSQVWEMDTSYVLFANFTIVLFVHFPVGHTKTKLKLVEYIPTPLKLGNDPQVYTLHSENSYLAVSSSRRNDFHELTYRDLMHCKKSERVYFCPKTFSTDLEKGESCLSALYWGEEEMAHMKCPLKPIPKRDVVTQLNPSEFVLSISGTEEFRFSCGEKDLGAIKMKGVVKVKIPRGCRMEGITLVLVPTYELSWNVGNVTVVPLEMTKGLNDSLVAFASDSGIYQKHSGIPGPSLKELDAHWTNQVLTEEKHESLREMVMRILYLGLGIFALVLLLKLVLWLCERRRVNSRIVRVTQDVENRCQEMEERSRHQLRCSELLRREMDPLTARDGDQEGVYDVPAPPQSVPSPASPATDGLSESLREVEESPIPRVRVYPLGTERVTYTNMRPRGRGATRGTGTRRVVKVRATGETPSQSDASEMWD